MIRKKRVGASSKNSQPLPTPTSTKTSKSKNLLKTKNSTTWKDSPTGNTSNKNNSRWKDTCEFTLKKDCSRRNK